MIAVGVTGYYLVAVAKLVDAALGLAMPTDVPLDRRRKFRVIEGWENSSYSARKSLNPDQLSPRRRNVH
jgi:hypothetical protein